LPPRFIQGDSADLGVCNVRGDGPNSPAFLHAPQLCEIPSRTRCEHRPSYRKGAAGNRRRRTSSSQPRNRPTSTRNGAQDFASDIAADGLDVPHPGANISECAKLAAEGISNRHPGRCLIARWTIDNLPFERAWRLDLLDIHALGAKKLPVCLKTVQAIASLIADVRGSLANGDASPSRASGAHLLLHFGALCGRREKLSRRHAAWNEPHPLRSHLLHSFARSHASGWLRDSRLLRLLVKNKSFWEIRIKNETWREVTH
jgi:hypothetical protein